MYPAISRQAQVLPSSLCRRNQARFMGACSEILPKEEVVKQVSMAFRRQFHNTPTLGDLAPGGADRDMVLSNSPVSMSRRLHLFDNCRVADA